MKTSKLATFILKEKQLNHIKGGAETSSTKVVNVHNTLVDDLNGLIR